MGKRRGEEAVPGMYLCRIMAWPLRYFSILPSVPPHGKAMDTSNLTNGLFDGNGGIMESVRIGKRLVQALEPGLWHGVLKIGKGGLDYGEAGQRAIYYRV